MSVNLQQSSGHTGVFGHANVGIGSTSSQYSIGSAFSFAINGRMYTRSSVASQAFAAHTGTSLTNIGSSGGVTFFALLIDASGNLTVVQGPVVARGERAPVPNIPANVTCYGGIKIDTTTTFTVGTTALTGVATYYNFAGRPDFSSI